jgi:hypothetical protein
MGMAGDAFVGLAWVPSNQNPSLIRNLIQSQKTWFRSKNLNLKIPPPALRAAVP